jgi:hypothetical protein
MASSGVLTGCEPASGPPDVDGILVRVFGDLAGIEPYTYKLEPDNVYGPIRSSSATEAELELSAHAAGVVQLCVIDPGYSVIGRTDFELDPSLEAPVEPPGAGPLELAGIELAGAAVPFAGVLADVTIRHGRTGYFDSPSPSTCTLTFVGVDRSFTRKFRLGSELVVTATDGETEAPRFTGRLTDATLVLDELTANAVASSRTFSGYTIGAGDWPAEPWSSRVARAFDEAGIGDALVLELGLFDPLLVARVGEPVTLLDYLGALVAMVDAATADLEDGRTLVQAIDSRSQANRYALDPAEVGFAPDWTIQLPESNIVAVSYGDPASSSSVTVRDQASVDELGPITATIATTVADLADATSIGNQRLARNAYPHWAIGDAPLLYGRRLPIGSPLELSELPSSAPASPWTPILEGWTDRVVSNGEELTWTMELALSDPLLSGLTLAWEGIPVEPDYLWETIDQTVAWRDALSLGDLAA